MTTRKNNQAFVLKSRFLWYTTSDVLYAITANILELQSNFDNSNI